MWRLATACRLEAAGWLASYNLQEGFDGFAGFVTKISIKILWCIVLDVGSLVVARLPHISTVAVRDGVDNPLGQVLGRRVEVLELFSTAIDVNLPIVAVQVLAFALIVEIELMAGGYF